MDQPEGTVAASHGSDTIAGSTPRPRGVGVVAIGLLLFAAVGGANLASSLLGFGYVAWSLPAANALALLVLAITPLFLARLLEPVPDAPPTSTWRLMLAATTATARELSWLLVLLPLLLIVGPVAAGTAHFLLVTDGRYLLVVLLVVGIVEFRRKPSNAATEPRPWRRLQRAAGWLWLLALLALWFGGGLPPLELVGTDPRDGCRYFARQLQRDRSMHRPWVIAARPLGGSAIAWHRFVTVEPPLPVDLATLRFEDGGVFADRHDGTSLRLTLH